MPDPKNTVARNPPGKVGPAPHNSPPSEICETCGNPRNPRPDPSLIKHQGLEVDSTVALLVKKLTERDKSSSRLERLATFSTSILQVAALGVVVVFVAMAATEVWSDYRLGRVLIDPIAVPKSFDEQGYSSQAVTNHLRDQIERLRDDVEQATAENEKTPAHNKGIATRVSGAYLAHPGRRQPIATTANLNTLPDLTIPETGLSLHGVVDLVDAFLEIQPRHVSGEITMVHEAHRAPEASASVSPQSTNLADPTTLRVTVRMDESDRARFFDHLVTDDPDTAIAQASEDALRLIDPYMAGLGSFYAGNLDVAIPELQEALELNPPDAGNIRIGLAQAYLGRATKYINDGKAKEAVDDLDQALKYQPGSAVAYNDRGAAHAGEEKFTEAIDDYTNAIKSDPRLELAYINRGSIYLREGDCKRAIADYQPAIDINPNAAEGLNALAWVLATCPDAQVRNGDEAVQLAEEASRVTNGSVAALEDTLAAAYAENGKFAQATQAEERAIRLEEDATKPRPDTLNELRARLALFKAQRAYHLPTNQQAP